MPDNKQTAEANRMYSHASAGLWRSLAFDVECPMFKLLSVSVVPLDERF
jgi:hypothetical protein